MLVSRSLARRARQALSGLVLSVLAVLALMPAKPAAQAGYTLVSLPSPATDVNDNGNVVGQWNGPNLSRGYLWTQATGAVPMISDAALRPRFPCAEPKINLQGVIVASASPTACGQAPFRAARYSTALGLEMGSTSEGDESQRATAVNSTGVAVGIFRGNSGVPFIWPVGGSVSVLPPFSNSLLGSAWDINDSSVVVGISNSSAFWWFNNQLSILPRVAGQSSSRHDALAINNNGQIVGRYFASGGVQGAFLSTITSTPVTTIDLQAPQANSITSMDINDDGHIVASIYTPAGRVPYLYRNGVWTDINTLRPPGSTLRLHTATAINSLGWIVGAAGPTESSLGYVLIPPVATTTLVSSSPNPTPYGTAATFTASVQGGGAPVTTGTVTFREGTTVLAGPLTLSAAGRASFVTAALDAGSHTIEATFSGAVGFLASSGSVVHVVNALVPTSQDDSHATAFETALTVPPPGVLSNDTSNGGGVMTATLDSNVSHGTLSLGTNGAFTYTPDEGYVGPDTFTYRASNSVGTGNRATVSIAVAQPTTAQPPTGLHVSSIRGNEVTFRWTPPALGPRPEQFVLTGGIQPGEVIATLPTGSTYPIFTVTVPDGAYYARIQSFAGGGTSDPSNAIRVFVNTPTRPSAPADLVGLVNGSTIGLAWRNTYEGAASTSMVLDVSGPVNTSIPIGPAESFVFSPVPAGIYTLAVRGVNGGGVGLASSPVTLTFPGECSGAPLPPARFLAYRIGRTVFVVWDPATSGPAPTAYLLQVTGSYVGDIQTTGRALSGTVGPGSYDFRVRASNACGTGAPTPTQTVFVD